MGEEIKALVVSDSCPHCEDIKEFLQKKKLLNKVRLIRYESDEGKEFCKKNNIRAVPECVVLKQDGKEVRVCSEQEFQKLIEEGC